MKLIIYNDKFGKCKMIVPNYNRKDDLLRTLNLLNNMGVFDEIDEQVYSNALDNVPDQANYVTTVDHTELPYNGWNELTKSRSAAIIESWINPPDTTSPPVVDMVKARKAKMDLEWRPKRNKLLTELDIDYQRADEDANQSKKAAIARDKKKLRDMPVDFSKAIEAITDPKELDDFDPVIDLIVNMESV